MKIANKIELSKWMNEKRKKGFDIIAIKGQKEDQSINIRWECPSDNTKVNIIYKH